MFLKLKYIVIVVNKEHIFSIHNIVPTISNELFAQSLVRICSHMSYSNVKLSKEIKLCPECITQFVVHDCIVHSHNPDSVQVQVPQS